MRRNRAKKESFGKKVVELREARKLSAKKFAKLLGKGERYVIGLEKDNILLTPTDVSRVMAALNVTEDERKQLQDLANKTYDFIFRVHFKGSDMTRCKCAKALRDNFDDLTKSQLEGIIKIIDLTKKDQVEDIIENIEK